MEMIIAILFFSLASAVCIQLFAKSHLLSTQTVNQNHAVIQAQNLAESYLALEGDINAMQDLFSPSEQISDDTLRLTLTAAGTSVPQKMAAAISRAGTYPGGRYRYHGSPDHRV